MHLFGPGVVRSPRGGLIPLDTDAHSRRSKVVICSNGAMLIHLLSPPPPQLKSCKDPKEIGEKPVILASSSCKFNYSPEETISKELRAGLSLGMYGDRIRPPRG